VSEREGAQRVLAPPPPGHRRLDPRTLVTRVVTLSSLRQYWGALLPLLAVLGINGGFRSGGLVAVLAAVVVVALVGALVEWLRTWYGVHDGRLVVERGVLRRSLTVVPVDRIRGVDLHASALQRCSGSSRCGWTPPPPAGARARPCSTRCAAPRARGCAPSCSARPRWSSTSTSTCRWSRRHRSRPSLGCRRRPWCWRGSTRGGCSTRRWSAATCSRHWPRSARWPTTPASSGLPLRRWAEDALGNEPGVRASSSAVAVVLVAVAGDRHRRGGQLGFADPARRHAGAGAALLSRRQVSLGDRIRGHALAEPLALRGPPAAGCRAGHSLGGGGTGRSGRRSQLQPARPGGSRAVAAPR
jgi:hypothetical protein